MGTVPAKAVERDPQGRHRLAGSLFDLDGRRALVTGSTRGIGAAIAQALAEAGASVVLHGRDQTRVDASVAALAATLDAQGANPGVSGVAFDISRPSEVQAALAPLVADGGVHILVNNAGMQLRHPLSEYPVSDWERVLATNLTSAFVVAQTLVHRMLDRGAGKIINICSVQNRLVRATTAPYAVSKGGLGTLTQSMCAEWAVHGIQANAIAPGYIATELNAALTSDPIFSGWIEGRTPAGRWGDVSDLVGPAVWLASSASDFVNGQLIHVDGGLTAVLQ
jgi:gluconate 5-dehydrogenase